VRGSLAWCNGRSAVSKTALCKCVDVQKDLNPGRIERILKQLHDRPQHPNLSIRCLGVIVTPEE